MQRGVAIPLFFRKVPMSIFDSVRSVSERTTVIGKELTFEIIPTDNMVEVLKSFEDNDIVFDYETNGLHIYSPDVIPIGFGITLYKDPYKMPKYFVVSRELTQSEKLAFLRFLDNRKTYVFNCPFEMGLTWRYFGEEVRMDDVLAQAVAAGVRAGLKPLSQRLLGVGAWAEVWDCLNVIESLVDFINKRKSHIITHLLTDPTMTLANFEYWAVNTQLKKYEQEVVIEIKKIESMMSFEELKESLRFISAPQQIEYFMSVPVDIGVKKSRVKNVRTLTSKVVMVPDPKKVHLGILPLE